MFVTFFLSFQIRDLYSQGRDQASLQIDHEIASTHETLKTLHLFELRFSSIDLVFKQKVPRGIPWSRKSPPLYTMWERPRMRIKAHNDPIGQRTSQTTLNPTWGIRFGSQFKKRPTPRGFVVGLPHAKRAIFGTCFLTTSCEYRVL